MNGGDEVAERIWQEKEFEIFFLRSFGFRLCENYSSPFRGEIFAYRCRFKMAENESDFSEKAKKVCKYCKKNVANGLVCKRCGAPYHNSCGSRIKTCCEQLLQEVPIVDSPNQIITEEVYLREENLLLRGIIKDKDTIITDKESIISLLNNKILYLQEQLKTITEEKTVNINKNKQQSKSKNITDKIDLVEPVTTKQKLNVITSKTQTNAEMIQSRQENIMKELINLNDANYDCPSKSVASSPQQKEEPFKTVIPKKKRYREPKICGEGQISKDDEINGFVGREPPQKKIWLFVTKVKDHVTKETVQKYIQNKIKSENMSNIYVGEIDTFRKVQDNKCFKVGLSYEHLEIAYTSAFWPKGVEVYRFNFKKEEKYLNRLKSANQQAKNFPTEPQGQDFT